VVYTRKHVKHVKQKHKAKHKAVEIT